MEMIRYLLVGLNRGCTSFETPFFTRLCFIVTQCRAKIAAPVFSFSVITHKIIFYYLKKEDLKLLGLFGHQANTMRMY